MKFISRRNRSENKKTSNIKPRVYSLILLKIIRHTFLVILVAADQQLSSNGKNVENQKLTTSRKETIYSVSAPQQGHVTFTPLQAHMLFFT